MGLCALGAPSPDPKFKVNMGTVDLPIPLMLLSPEWGRQVVLLLAYLADLHRRRSRPDGRDKHHRGYTPLTDSWTTKTNVESISR